MRRPKTERRRLRIGIDARDLLVTPRTGVERVVYQFIDSLSRVRDPHHEYVLLLHEQPAPELLPADLPGEIVVEPMRFGRLQRIGDAWMTLQMRRVAAAQRLDGFLTPNTKFPFARVPRFTCVHGIEWHFCPDDYSKKELLKQRLWFRLCTRWSTGIVTFARASEEGIRRLRPRCRVPICVVPEGVDAMFRRLTDTERSVETLARCGVRSPFVLSVCSLEQRKNLDALVRAFARAVAQHDLPHQLVLVGRAGQTSARLRDLIAENGLETHVQLPGYVDDDDLVQLYNQAELFVYPSKYEGFGLPVLEAMACGAPVVTSNRGALVEVGGDAIRGYEVWTPLLVNRIVDIGDVVALKREALEQFPTQSRHLDLVNAAIGLAQYRAIHAGERRGYAEAFHESSPAAYRLLMERFGAKR